MANKKLIMGMSTVALAAIMAASVNSSVYAADGDLWKDGTKIGGISQVVLQHKAFDLIRNIDTYGYEVESKLYDVTEVNNVFKANPTATTATIQASVKADLTAVVDVPVVETELKVSSVSAINAETLKVTFTQAVDPITAVDLAHYTINGTPLSVSDTVTKADDNKSVTIKLVTSNLLENDTSYAIGVNGIKDLSLVNDVPMYSQVLKFSDTVSPTASVSYNSGIEAKVNFTEAMSSLGTVKVYDTDNVDVTSDFLTVANPSFALSTDKKSFTIDMTDALVLNATAYTVKIVGASDLAGNLINANPTVLSITKTVSELTKPTVKVITANGSSKVIVTYSEKVSTPGTVAVAGASAMTIDTDSDTGNATVDSTGLVYTVTLDTANAVASKTAGLYNVALAGYIDMSGNAGLSSTSVVSFPGDVTGPAYISQSVVDIAGTKYLVVKFDSAVTTNVIANDATATLVDADGIQSAPGVTFVGNVTTYNPTGAATTDSIKINLAAFGANGAYTFALPASTVQDNVNNNSKKIAMTFVKDDVTGDTTAPIINVTGAGNTGDYSLGYNVQSVTNGNNVIEVKFTEALDKTTALNVNNYLIDNQVAAKSVVFDFDTKTVKITLNDAGVALTGDHLFTVKGVKDVAGNTMKTVTTTLVNLKENVAPVVTTAKVTSTSAITLTFSEAVKATGTVTAGDFNIYVDGVLVTQSASDSLSMDKKSIILNLSTPLTTTTLAKTITLTKSDDNDVTDLLLNKLVSSTITVAK
jgi:hypothetical protein